MLLLLIGIACHRPESLGLVCAATYILLLILFIPFPFSQFLSRSESEGLASVEFPHFQVRCILVSIE